MVAAPLLPAQELVIGGTCRDGEPNGAYTLRAPDGRLRVAGAFAKGRRTGTFLFWSERGARIAVIPYDNDRKVGTIATGTRRGRRKGTLRANPKRPTSTISSMARSGPGTKTASRGRDLRYEHGELVEARALAASGAPLIRRRVAGTRAGRCGDGRSVLHYA